MTDESSQPGAPDKTPEPVAIAGAAQALITAVLTVLTVFHVWSPTPEQVGALLALLTAVIGVATVLVRQRVTPWRLPKIPKGMTFEQFLDELALAAYAHVDGVEEAPPDAEDLHALDAPHGVNQPEEQGGA